MKRQTKKPQIVEAVKEDGKILCHVCDISCTYAGGHFSSHLRKSHSITVQQYYKLWQKDESLWLCQCGCSNETSWQPRGGYFIDFVNGHNFKGKTKDNDEVVSRRAKKMVQNEKWQASTWQKGHKPWNQGMTCETNDVVKLCVDALRNWKLFASSEKIADVMSRRIATTKRNFSEGKRVSGFLLLDAHQASEMRLRALRTMALRGSFPNSRKFKTGYFTSSKSGKTFFYGSSYELERMRHFDANENIAYWGRCKDLVEFVSTVDGKPHHYNPDFEIISHDGNVIIEEVKGIITQETVDKAKAAISYYELQRKCYKLITKLKGSDAFVEIPVPELQKHMRNVIL